MYYLEFIHEQSDWVTGTTFDDISNNQRLFKFEIITKDFFKYDGWYNYFLYEDDTKSTQIDEGKCYLKSDNNNFIYNKDKEEKTIYKR